MTRNLCLCGAIGLSICAILTAPAEAGETSRTALPFPPDAAETVIRLLSPASETALEAVTIAAPAGAPITAEEGQEALKAEADRRLLETQCGPVNDVQDVERYDGRFGPFDDPRQSRDFVSRHQGSTAQIQWNSDLPTIYRAPDGDPGNVTGLRMCTGTLISEDLLLTAGHCFDKEGNGLRRPKRRQRREWLVIEPSEIAMRMHLNLNYQHDGRTGAVRQPVQFPIVELLEHKPGGKDFAIVRVGRNRDGDLPGARFGFRAVAEKVPPLGHDIVIIQHPHGEPKKVHGGKLGFTTADRLYYETLDTFGGSSGSGVLDREGNLIGVHVSGGCTLPEFPANEAVSITAIRAASDLL